MSQLDTHWEDQCPTASIGKTAESPTTILIQDWFKNYELKWGFGGLPPIITLVYINLVEYNI